MPYPDGLVTKTFRCGECKVPHTMTVRSDGPDDPKAIDRFRLLAASMGCVLDLDDQLWCPRHRWMAAC